jgi:predicted dehydrogenase
VFGAGLPEVRLVSVADINEALAADTARRYGFERTDGGWQAIAEAEDVDAVSVVVANPLHREVVEGLLAAGKHVLCEKPLAPTIADAQAMADAAATADPLGRVGFTFRRHAGIHAVHDLITSGALGRPLHFSGRYWCDYACDPNGPISWRFKGGPGSGALADIGSHLGDVGEFLCGEAVSVTGATLTTHITDRPLPLGQVIGHDHAEVGDEREPVENDDTAAYGVRYAGGATGTVEVSRTAHGHPNTLKFEVLCERGTASYDNSRPAEFAVKDGSGPGFRRVLLGPEHLYVGRGMAFDGAGIGFGHNEAFIYQARAFLDEIVGRSELPPCPSFGHGLHNLQVQQAVVAAAATGETTSVPAPAHV